MTNESTVQDAVKLASAQLGARLWRNNSGAMKTPQGGFVRFGLASDVPKCASSDLIGITPINILPQHFGMTFGVFTAPEIKHSTWSYGHTPHEGEQLTFINMVRKAGGFAGFCTSVDDYYRMIGATP